MTRALVIALEAPTRYLPTHACRWQRTTAYMLEVVARGHLPMPGRSKDTTFTGRSVPGVNKFLRPTQTRSSQQADSYVNDGAEIRTKDGAT